MAESKDQRPITILGVSAMFDEFLAKVFEKYPEDIPTNQGHLKPLKDSFAAGVIGVLQQTTWLLENEADRELMLATWKAWKHEANLVISMDPGDRFVMDGDKITIRKGLT